jgi:phage FluMu protein Com
MGINKRLPVVQSPDKQASILAPTVAPVLKGDESENLLCGGCSAMLGEGVSENTISTRFAAPVQLLIKCPKCGAYNELPAKIAQ